MSRVLEEYSVTYILLKIKRIAHQVGILKSPVLGWYCSMNSWQIGEKFTKFYRNESMREVNLTMKCRVVCMSYPGNRSYSWVVNSLAWRSEDAWSSKSYLLLFRLVLWLYDPSCSKYLKYAEVPPGRLIYHVTDQKTIIWPHVLQVNLYSPQKCILIHSFEPMKLNSRIQQRELGANILPRPWRTGIRFL